MSAEEFLKETSPNDDFGLRADLNSMKITKHVLEIMRRFAQIHVAEALNSASKAVKYDYSELSSIQKLISTSYPLDAIE